ncbi:hypothetical protein TVAG_063710 [Trichomonas vaginalis G3]|uniref:Uncharacterized protein n=1 Tax=Trichomonas vaginalis (strain ATCC PRA-98 / G3) TaxID=412133 RepID=A2EU41_TRIV3|nr:CNH domain containing family [Trichomonas vaginalis G3]EAY03858.1 hypothetical protein TVAG_063710 [Trichomonas vaginalis G3]KAI5487477.1 CNH domain containing family [Trichomonas vaginalis G3]|eukprot:XP_001316081.1 hypothetical protein [Trichomonas vaginalis G3]
MKSVHQYLMVPLDLGLENKHDSHRIQTIAHIDQKLVVVRELEDYKARFSFYELGNLNGVVTATKDGDALDISFGDYYIKEIKSYNDSLILYLKSTDSAPLCKWKPGVDSPLYFTYDCDFYALNQYSLEMNQSIIYTKKNILTFIPDYSNIDDKKEIEFEEDILSVSLNYPSALVVLKNAIVKINLNQPDDRIKMSNPCENLHNQTNHPSPTSICASRTSYIFFTENMASYINQNLDARVNKINFDNVPFNNTKVPKGYFSTTDTSQYIYDFANEPFKLPGIGLHSTTAMKIDARDYTFFANDKHVYQLFDVYEAFDLLSRNQMKDLSKKLPDAEAATICAFFQVAWNNTIQKTIQNTVQITYPFRDMALKLFDYPEFRRYILDILTLFSQLHFYVHKKEYDEEEEEIGEEIVEYEPRYFEESQLDSSPQSLQSLLAALKQHYPKELKNTVSKEEYEEIARIQEIFQTATLEILILQKKTPEISQLIKSKNNYNKDIIIKFMDTIPDHSTRLIVYSLLGEAKLAMKSFALTTDRSTEVIDIVIGLLKANSGDWEFIKEHADSFIKADPIRGMEILTDPRVDMNKATAYVTENFPALQQLFLLGTVHNSSLVGRSTIIAKLANDLCTALSSLHKPDFDYSTVSYLKCVIRSPNGHPPIEDIERELSDYLQNLVSTEFNELDKTKLLNSVADFTSSSLKISIFLAADKYKEALDIIWANNNGDPEKAALSCRDCSNPPKAFELLIEKVKAELSQEEFLSELTKLLTKNIDIIDISYALGSLNTNASLDTTLMFVEQLYRSLIATKRDAEIEAAHAEAEQFEAQYRLLRAQAVKIAVNEDVDCEGCGKKLGYSTFERTPTGALYHRQCINKK